MMKPLVLTAEQRALLVDFARSFDANPENGPPILRSRREAARYTTELILKIASPEGDAHDLEELAQRLKSGPHWERGLLTLEPGSVWQLDESNLEAWRETGRPGQIWIRWDVLPSNQRKTAVSTATILSDLAGGRRGAGRPAGSRLTAKERSAIEALGPSWQATSWQRGWSHMTSFGAWARDGRGDLDPKAQRARAARWSRLILRSQKEPHAKYGHAE